MAGERWSAADLNTLKRAYPDWGAEPVAAITGRSIDAVRHMASRLGLEATHHKQRPAAAPEAIYTAEELVALAQGERDHYAALLAHARHLIEREDDCRRPCPACRAANVALGYEDEPATHAQ